MNEAYLNLGFPIILRKDEFQEMWFYYFSIRQDYHTHYLCAKSPNGAIEEMNQLGLIPIAMHFFEGDVFGVRLHFIAKY